MREAFTYMFKDRLYSNKALTYFFFAFVALFLQFYSIPSTGNITNQALLQNTNATISMIVAGFISIFVNFFINGYFFCVVEAIVKQNDYIVLPFFNPILCFIRGGKFFISTILFSIVSMLLCALPMLLIPFIPSFIPIILTLALGIFISFIFTALIWIFVNTNKVTALLNFKKACSIISPGKGLYIKNIVWMGLVSIIGTAAATLFMLFFNFTLVNHVATSIAAAIEAAIIAAYLIYVNAYFLAKSIRPECIKML